jgi:5-formyltetrahydrofolate cyclo-ligase
MARRRESDVANAFRTLRPQLEQLDAWQRARRVLLYFATPEEIDLNGLFGESSGKEWCLPRCAPNRTLTIHPVNTDQRDGLVTSRFGVREPRRESPQVAPDTIDLVIVPALAFDERGYRLGYGGGYYDRFLPRLHPDCVTVGLTLDALIVPILPTEPHDAPVQIVITESRVIRRADTTAPTPPPYSG